MSTLRLALRGIEDRILVDEDRPAVPQHDAAVDDDGVDVVAVGEIDQAELRHVRPGRGAGGAGRRASTSAFLPSSSEPISALHAERPGRIDRAHLQHLARRQPARVAEEGAVVMHALLHVPEHVGRTGPARSRPSRGTP